MSKEKWLKHKNKLESNNKESKQFETWKNPISCFLTDCVNE